MTNKTCLNCKFWAQWPEQPNPGMTLGDCRRNAPQVFAGRDKFMTKFPSTKHGDFCGAFKACREITASQDGDAPIVQRGDDASGPHF
jgi:hypothetical protein